MWPTHCTAQKAYNCTKNTPNCLLWRHYIVWTPPPFLFAKTPIWGLKNVEHLPDSPTPPEFSEGGRGPFLYMHSRGKSPYRIVGLHPFFITNTMALHQALWLGWMAPDSSISQRRFHTSSTKGRGICLIHSLKGVSSVTLDKCLVEWVQPNSAGSNEKHIVIFGQQLAGICCELWWPWV